MLSRCSRTGPVEESAFTISSDYFIAAGWPNVACSGTMLHQLPKGPLRPLTIALASAGRDRGGQNNSERSVSGARSRSPVAGPRVGLDSIARAETAHLASGRLGCPFTATPGRFTRQAPYCPYPAALHIGSLHSGPGLARTPCRDAALAPALSDGTRALARAP
jgi:hypothetical protein